ncbi:MAG: hypothetical protein AB1805_09155 [Nitrospirota bacterium]
MKRLVLVVLIVPLLAACGGKKDVKKVSEDSKLATEAFAVAEALKDAYTRKDIAAIEKNTTKEGLQAVSRTVRSFDSADLSFTPAWVEIEDGTVHLNVSWKGTWKRGSAVTEERGMAVFVMKGRPLRVDAILRANPFRHPE